MELKAGLGKIIIDEEVLKMAKNKFLILSLSRMKGPCKDEMRMDHVIAVAKISDSNRFLTSAIFQANDSTVAVEERMARIIDKERETIEIRRGIRGNLVIRGFIPG